MIKLSCKLVVTWKTMSVLKITLWTLSEEEIIPTTMITKAGSISMIWHLVVETFLATLKMQTVYPLWSKSLTQRHNQIRTLSYIHRCVIYWAREIRSWSHTFLTTCRTALPTSKEVKRLPSNLNIYRFTPKTRCFQNRIAQAQTKTTHRW